MRVVAFLAVICVSFALAQPASPTENPTPSPEPTPEVPPQYFNPMNMAMAQAQQEQMIAKTYLDVMLKLQVSQYNTMASYMYMSMLYLEHTNGDSKSPFFGFLERESFTKDLEEEDGTLFGVEGDDDDDDVEAALRAKQAKIQLLASYQLLSATRTQKYQIVFYSGELQNEFFMDRAMTIASSMGGQLPAPLLQMLYLKNYSTLLKTMKLSQAFQMNSHFTTWLEDAVGVYSAVVANTNDASDLAESLSDELIEDKMFAFMAYYQFATLDLQTFYIDYYLEMTFAQMSAPQGAGAPPPQASFLEEGETAEPNQFMPYMYMNSPQLYMKMYKMYFTMFQLYAAQSGLSSVFAESMAYKMENDDDLSNDEKAEKIRSYSQMLFAGGFAGNLQRASQLQQITAIFELYSLYGSFMQQGQGQPQPPQAAH